MAASYENNEPLPVEDPMLLTIRETASKLDSLRADQNDMSSKINYLRDIRPRALQLLAQADAAEEEANRLEAERATIDKEIERLRSVVNRMEDMRYSTKQLTDQMHLDTALQMRHILENGKSIVPRTDSPTSAGLPNPAASGSPATGSSVSKYSPSRQLSLTPGSSGVANYAALAASEAAVSRQSLAGTQQPFVDVPSLPTTATVAVMPAVPVLPVLPVNGTISASPGSGRILHNMTPPAAFAATAVSSAALGTNVKSEPGLPMFSSSVGYPMVAGVVPTAIPTMSVPLTTNAGPPYGSPPVVMYGVPATTMNNGGSSVSGGGVGFYSSTSTMATALSQKDENLKSEAQFAGEAEGNEDGRARDALFR
ncbi:hypothetical protein FRC04_008962 [Tulasnella sp. 424]|nr:hypothetical protein FRC04_008962 [Tulasnella sp. 424]KAG8973618.1 hypothetical protein FRC05_008554 [Tulasnella sp. 425]